MKDGLKIIDKTKQIFHTGPFHSPSLILLFLHYAILPSSPTFRYKSVTRLVHSIALLIGQCEQFFPLFLSLKQKLSYYITEKRNTRFKNYKYEFETEIYRSSRKDVKVHLFEKLSVYCNSNSLKRNLKGREREKKGRKFRNFHVRAVFQKKTATISSEQFHRAREIDKNKNRSEYGRGTFQSKNVRTYIHSFQLTFTSQSYTHSHSNYRLLRR